MKRRQGSEQGYWATKVCPPGSFTVFDAAGRLGCSVRHVRRLMKQHRIPAGLVRKSVRLADGRVVTRRLTTLPPSAMEQLLLAHCGATEPSSPDPLTETSRPATYDVSAANSTFFDADYHRTMIMRKLNRLHQMAEDAFQAGDLERELASTKAALDIEMRLLQLIAFYQELQARGR